MGQYVGHVAFIAGTLKERRRCKEFIKWLLAQRRGSVTIPDVSNRDDATEMHIPENCKGWVTGNRGSELRCMEQEKLCDDSHRGRSGSRSRSRSCGCNSAVGPRI